MSEQNQFEAEALLCNEAEHEEIDQSARAENDAEVFSAEDQEGAEPDAFNDLEFGENAEKTDESTALREEICALRKELEARRELDRANERIRTELSEFSEYFPKTELSEVPDEIWQKVKSGASLSGAYALYLRKSELDRQKADGFNKKNRQMSAGSLEGGEGEKYFSPSEVKRMTQAEVRENYDEIMRSMRHWS